MTSKMVSFHVCDVGTLGPKGPAHIPKDCAAQWEKLGETQSPYLKALLIYILDIKEVICMFANQ